MILLIDNYDSFVYNLSRYVGRLGVERTVVRNDMITVEAIKQMQPSHIILSPGPCAPQQAGICLSLIVAMAATTPILGICLGHQAIAEAFGGKIVRAEQPMHGKDSQVYHEAQGVLAKLPQPFTAGRYHSLVVAPETLPACLHVTARTDDGTIMALQHADYPLHGVQFHPESVLTPQGNNIIVTFITHYA